MMNCIAVDDEQLALDLIESFITKVPFLKLVKLCRNAMDAANIIRNQEIDLIFLDINMPNLSGLEFVKGLVKKPMVIFTTAYSEYAVEGFNVNAIDYLIKPFMFDRFFQAANKAYEYHSLIRKEMVVKDGSQDNDVNYFFVKSEYSIVKILFEDILFIEGLKDYLKIHLKEDHILTLMTMKGIVDILPSSKFIRVHRSYIVSIENIESIHRNRILIGEDRIPIGNNFKDDFYNRIGKF